jgi:peroxiredoxin
MRSLSSSIFLLFLFLSVPAQGMCEPKTGIEVGNLAPSFELRNLNGEKIALTDYRGKIVLLNFWSTLCVPCTAEMPSLNKLHLTLVDKGFQVLAVSIDTSEKPVKMFVEEKKIVFPVIMDNDKAVFFDDFAGPSLPASYLIDRNGIIIETFSGPRVWDSPDMRSRISKLLDKR